MPPSRELARDDGQARPELREDLRSLAFGNHVIFLRYVAGYLEIVDVLEGHRDIDAYFNPKPDDEGGVENG